MLKLLPVEIVIEIFSKLPYLDLHRLQYINKFFQIIILEILEHRKIFGKKFFL